MKKQSLMALLGAILIGFAGLSTQLQAHPVSAQTATSAPTMAATTDSQKFTLFNLNTVTSEQILSIPGIARSMTREFAEYRPWISIQQFRKKIGKYVDAATITGYEQYVYVPIQIDASDADTLKQIPGVTDQIAADLIAARPYKTNDAFLAKLATVLAPAQVAYAWNYLEGNDATLQPTVAATTAATSAATSAPTLAATDVATLPAFALFNLNTVTSEQILSIPGIARSMTREFAEYRPWISIQQFRKEISKYVDAATITGYEQYVYVPIQIDASDADTLKQIPGVTDQIAADLIAARPYKTNDAFLAKLAAVLAPAQVSYAANYLETQ